MVFGLFHFEIVGGAETWTYHGGVQKRGTVVLGGHETPDEKRRLEHVVKRYHQPQQLAERLFKYHYYCKHEPIREPFGGTAHVVRVHRVGRQLLQHLHGGERGINEPDQFAGHRPVEDHRVDQRHSRDADRQPEPVDASALLGPGGQTEQPRLVQRRLV